MFSFEGDRRIGEADVNNVSGGGRGQPLVSAQLSPSALFSKRKQFSLKSPALISPINHLQDVQVWL
jgi:hypothetical protein